MKSDADDDSDDSEVIIVSSTSRSSSSQGSSQSSSSSGTSKSSTSKPSLKTSKSVPPAKPAKSTAYDEFDFSEDDDVTDTPALRKVKSASAVDNAKKIFNSPKKSPAKAKYNARSWNKPDIPEEVSEFYEVKTIFDFP
nr:wings apart-like protein homolog [Lytechinus pictus]